jgi:hypothetical protein
MPRAILKNGVIYPVDPLPPTWSDGKEVWVEECSTEIPEKQDSWLQEFEAMVAENDADDIARLEQALKEADDLAKDQVRRQMGLP